MRRQLTGGSLRSQVRVGRFYREPSVSYKRAICKLDLTESSEWAVFNSLASRELAVSQPISAAAANMLQVVTAARRVMEADGM